MNRFAYLVCAVSLSGCASWFLNGAKMADHDYAQGQPGGFRIVGCTTIPDGSPVAPPNTTYHLIQDGGSVSLFERSPDGKGALINNHWTDTDGEHYFTWVKQSGWEFIVPKDKPPTRLVYVGVSELKGPDGATRPTTKPAATCEMGPI